MRMSKTQDSTHLGCHSLPCRLAVLVCERELIDDKHANGDEVSAAVGHIVPALVFKLMDGSLVLSSNFELRQRRVKP